MNVHFGNCYTVWSYISKDIKYDKKSQINIKTFKFSLVPHKCISNNGNTLPFKIKWQKCTLLPEKKIQRGMNVIKFGFPKCIKTNS